MTLLPGRVAVLVPDATASGIVLPEAIRERWQAMERPPFRLLCGKVVGVGRRLGRVDMPALGSTVWVLPKPGLIVYPDDVDVPSVGATVPAGHTLRIYGCGDPWYECVLLTHE